MNKKTFTNCLILIFFLQITCSSFALAKKNNISSRKDKPQIAFIHHIEQYSNLKILNQITENLKLSLDDDFKLISKNKISQEINLGTMNTDLAVEGDILYKKAIDFYLNFKFKESLSLLDEAIEAYQKNPGIQSGFWKTYLLKSQILSQSGKRKESLINLKIAIQLDLLKNSIDDKFFSPSIRYLYKVTKRNLIKNLKVVNVDVQIKRNRKEAIYLNGNYIGNGPILQIPVVEGREFKIQAGYLISQKPKSYTASLNKPLRIKLYARNPKGQNSKNGQIAIKTKTFDKAIDRSLLVGYNLNAKKVILLSLNKSGVINRLKIAVLDPRSKKMSFVKTFTLSNGKKNIELVSRYAQNFILTKSKFINEKYADYENEIVVVKRKKISPVVIGVISAVAIGGIVGVVMGLSGGSSSSSGTTTTIGGTIPASIK